MTIQRKLLGGTFVWCCLLFNNMFVVGCLVKLNCDRSPWAPDCDVLFSLNWTAGVNLG